MATVRQAPKPTHVLALPRMAKPRLELGTPRFSAIAVPAVLLTHAPGSRKTRASQLPARQAGLGSADLQTGCADGIGMGRWIGCEHPSLVLEARKMLGAAGKHHRRRRHLRCRPLIEGRPTIARRDHQLVLGSAQVIATTGHLPHFTPHHGDAQMFASAQGATLRMGGPYDSRRPLAAPSPTPHRARSERPRSRRAAQTTGDLGRGLLRSVKTPPVRAKERRALVITKVRKPGEQFAQALWITFMRTHTTHSSIDIRPRSGYATYPTEGDREQSARGSGCACGCPSPSARSLRWTSSRFRSNGQTQTRTGDTTIFRDAG